MSTDPLHDRTSLPTCLFPFPHDLVCCADSPPTPRSPDGAGPPRYPHRRHSPNEGEYVRLLEKFHSKQQPQPSDASTNALSTPQKPHPRKPRPRINLQKITAARTAARADPRALKATHNKLPDTSTRRTLTRRRCYAGDFLRTRTGNLPSVQHLRARIDYKRALLRVRDARRRRAARKAELARRCSAPFPEVRALQPAPRPPGYPRTRLAFALMPERALDALIAYFGQDPASPAPWAQAYDRPMELDVRFLEWVALTYGGEARVLIKKRKFEKFVGCGACPATPAYEVEMRRRFWRERSGAVKVPIGKDYWGRQFNI